MSIPQTGGGPIEHHDQLAQYLAEGCKPKEDWRIGTEHEKFGYDKDTLLPLPYEGPRSVKAMLEGLRDEFNWAPVLEVAREHAREQGMEARTEFLEGDARSVDLGGPYDLVLVTQFLHHFPREACLDVLCRLRAAMAPGGKLAVVEFTVDEDRVSPPPAARFSLVLLATTAGGDGFTAAELESLVTEAGFGEVEVARIPDAEASALFATA